MTLGDLLEGLAREVPARRNERVVTAEASARDVQVTAVTHDSRCVAPGTVFVACRGLQFDGVRFVPQAIAAGAVAIIAEQPPDAEVSKPWVVVPDARIALGWLAAELQGHPSRQMLVVGITGTNGKTTTCYLLSAIFEAAGVRCGLMGTVTYRVGTSEREATRTTPEAPQMQMLLREMLTAGCKACVMEVSSHALALQRVAGTRFSAAVFTNLTRDHLDFHTEMEGYFAAKRKLFERLPETAPAVVNLDDARGSVLAEMVGNPVTYAINRAADVTPGPLSFSLSGLTFDARTPQGAIRVRSRLVGRPNVYNILAAIATAGALGLPKEAIEKGIEELEGVPGRFEVASASSDDITAIVDYAHTDDALKNLLETARPLSANRLITVFGCGGERDRAKRPLMGMVAAALSDVVVVTSDNPRSEDPSLIIEEVVQGALAQRHNGETEILALEDRREAINEAVRRARPGDMVLVTGKGHEKSQEIQGRVLPFDDLTVVREALAARTRSRVGE